MSVHLDDLRNLSEPYFCHSDGLPGLDFNREIIEPGTHAAFPDGAIGIRVDDDFWAVAAIPLTYRDTPLTAVVRTLWPHYADEATFCPDSGSTEQALYRANNWARSQDRMVEHLNNELQKARFELDRLANGRPELIRQADNRVRAEKNYFVRQYEHLAVALAHEAMPKDEQRGICAQCGLLASDRVHSKQFIERHAAGYEPALRHLAFYGDDND